MEGPQIAGSTAARDAARDWAAVRASEAIQYAPLPPAKPPEPPAWLKWLNDLLESVFGPIGRLLGTSADAVKYGLLAIAVIVVLVALWRLVLSPLLDKWRAAGDEAGDWTPGAHAAAALLDEADRLAAEGRYGEATHLLLHRSVEHIAETRPEWLLPASTAREIATFPMLSEQARVAFAVIATRVERCAFALRDLDADDWHAAREAYSRFALAGFAA
ncbi:hypothetical protein B2G71_15860 [Novosphingobium sp. PC22D]|nr:hypothetical protein B2G71_15860 [Novosphingobium sp. PC22D]